MIYREAERLALVRRNVTEAGELPPSGVLGWENLRTFNRSGFALVLSTGSVQALVPAAHPGVRL